MQTVAPPSIFRAEFLRQAEWRKAAERELKHRKDREEREKKADRDGQVEGDLLVAMATEQEIADFEVTLDTYDAATVQALQDNEVQLTEAREELQLILDQAYITPDGRKVFRTEDGSRVFDEHGVEVEDVDPEAVEEWRPDYETYAGADALVETLKAEREQLVEYQETLDAARERVDSDEPLSHSELEALREQIEQVKPEAVKRALGEPVADAVATPAPEEFDPSALAIRRPTGPGPGA